MGKIKLGSFFQSNFIENINKNEFINIPDDLKKFLDNKDGTMKPITEILEPGKYTISITIESLD